MAPALPNPIENPQNSHNRGIDSLPDAIRIRTDLGTAQSKPAILPILYKPTKAVEAEAEKQYVCLIKPHEMTKFDALAEIDRLMRLKRAAVRSSTQSPGTP